MKKIITVVAAMMIAALSFAQNSLKLVLVDASTGEGVPFATVSLTPDGATKAVKYTLTNDEGKASMEGLKKGSYVLKGELLGYKPMTQAVKVEGRVDLGAIKMELDSQMLDAASVSAVGNPIVIKKDTVEYNASSFKTTDNDVLEDLLKKLPGVEVGSDGTITANGKTISKITIDGKTFFLDDPSLASKNLPAKIVEKVKVVDKKSDQAMFTGIDDGEEETIIDLSIRPGMMNGWFGSVMAGGGHDLKEVGMANASWDDARWQGASMIGRFTDKSQISVILNANNTNNRGFNDLAGNMMSAMRGGGGMGGGPMGGGMGGWGMGNGITTSWMGGLNGAWTLCDGDMDLAGNYLYNGSNRFVKESSYRETYLDDGSAMLYDKDGSSTTRSGGHRFGIRLEHKFTEKTSILFEPQFNFGSGSYSQFSDDITLSRAAGSDVADSLNRGFTSGDGANRNWRTSGFLLFRQRLNKPGRTLSANVRYSVSQNNLNSYNQSLSRVYMDGEWKGDPTNQFSKSASNSYSVNGRLSYTEPLAAKLFLETSYQYGWNRNVNNKDTYNLDFAEGAIDLSGLSREYHLDDEAWRAEHYDVNYSNNIVNSYQNHSAGLTLQYQTDKLRLQAGASYQPTVTHNVTNGKNYDDVAHNWSPTARISWDISDNADFRINYRGRSSQPSTSQLMPVPDNSNPLAVSFGNPYLTPYFSHSIRGNIGYTDRKTFFSIHSFFSANMVQDGISNATWVDSKGVTYSMPMNGGLTGGANVGMFLNAPIAKSGFSVMNMANVSFNESKSYVGRTTQVAALCEYYDQETGDFKYNDFYYDFLADGKKEAFDTYFITNRIDNLSVSENLRFTYRNDFIEAVLGGGTRVNKPWYSKEMGVDQKATWNNRVTTSVQWTPSFGLTLKSDLSYNWYRGYTTAQPDEWIWNAQISQLLFKNTCTIALNAYDILGQAKNLTVTDNANFHQEVRNNTLGRYIMLSFTYRFGNFNKAGQQMRARMGGGPGPGPGGPGPRR